MNKIKENRGRELAEHFFRHEYGKLVALVSRYLGGENVETAEDIVQETLLKAVDYWQHNAVPENPQAWLYITAKNNTLNILKRKKYQRAFEDQTTHKEVSFVPADVFELTEEEISDEQLKMMFSCCDTSLTESAQIVLVLKTLCGFSIVEIASAFRSNTETINKKLVRARKQVRESKVAFDLPEDINLALDSVLKTIYLLFNEGYSPAQKDEAIRYDLCVEAIRLTILLIENKSIQQKSNAYALLALMYFNASRFEARTNAYQELVEMNAQNRANWHQDFINKGLQYLEMAMASEQLSYYFILAAISAQHCISPSYNETNWKEILSLYEHLLLFEDSQTIRLNRAVVLAEVEGNQAAIGNLKTIERDKNFVAHYLFYATLATLHQREKENKQALNYYKKALECCGSSRDKKFLRKKIAVLVPI